MCHSSSCLFLPVVGFCLARAVRFVRRARRISQADTVRELERDKDFFFLSILLVSFVYGRFGCGRNSCEIARRGKEFFLMGCPSGGAGERRGQSRMIYGLMAAVAKKLVATWAEIKYIGVSRVRVCAVCAHLLGSFFLLSSASENWPS